MQLYLECLSIDKDSAEALQGRGECWSALGAFQEAIKDYKECQTVAEKTKNDACALLCARALMDMYRKTGRFEESISTGANVLKSGLNDDDGSLEEEVERMRYAYHIFQNAEEDEREKRYADAVVKYTQLLEMDCGKGAELRRCSLSLGENSDANLKIHVRSDSQRRFESGRACVERPGVVFNRGWRF